MNAALPGIQKMRDSIIYHICISNAMNVWKKRVKLHISKILEKKWDVVSKKAKTDSLAAICLMLIAVFAGCNPGKVASDAGEGISEGLSKAGEGISSTVSRLESDASNTGSRIESALNKMAVPIRHCQKPQGYWRKTGFKLSGCILVKKLYAAVSTVTGAQTENAFSMMILSTR